MRAKFYPLMLGALLAVGIGTAHAKDKEKDATPPEKAISKELVPPLQAAQQALGEKNYQAVLDNAATAEAAKADRTPYENFLITEMRLQAYLGLKDNPHLAEALETELASGQLAPEEAARRSLTLAQVYYQDKNYAKFLEKSDALVQAGTAPAEFYNLRCQAQYSLKNFDATGPACQAAIDVATKAGQPAPEQIYQMQLDSTVRRKDYSAYVDGLGEILKYYPKQDYWADYLTFMQKKPGYSDRLTLDVYRLMLRVNAIKEGNEYLDMADLASHAALPGEAKAVLEKGQPLLGGNPTAKQMLAESTKAAAEDQKTIDKTVAEAAKAPTGVPLEKLGQAYASYGNYPKAIELIQQGIAKGVKEPNDAKLHLAEVYVAAGQKDQAVKIFQELANAGPGFKELSNGWLIYLNQPA
ncbi:MAG: tetratricopeptide repeat protein [Azospirillaceae bacterium]|nr:tetratricopeptide repeat protein [Azospirillaceae bacterium]